jgi:hypothetical protein
MQRLPGYCHASVTQPLSTSRYSIQEQEIDYMPFTLIFNMNICANYIIEYRKQLCQGKESAGRLRAGSKLLQLRFR